MRNWRTSQIDMLCGYCLKTIHKGTPYLSISFHEVKKQKRRCLDCAGELPHDIDAPIPPAGPSILHPLMPLVQAFVNKPTRDFKTQAAEREPGEDD